MIRMNMTNWRGRPDGNAELEWDVPVQRSTPIERPVDLLDEEAPFHRPTPTVQSVESFDVSEDVGRYLPFGVDAVPVSESGLDVSFGFGGGSGLYDPALDEFFGGPTFGDAHAHGPLGGSHAEVPPPEAAFGDDVIVTAAADAEDIVQAFIALPHDFSGLPLNAGGDAFDVQGVEPTFGGGDDPLWMLTLLPSPDDHFHDTGFGHPGPGFDPWG